MDLNALLKKTEVRSAKIKATRQPPSIATGERPYENDLGQSASINSELSSEKAQIKVDKTTKNTNQQSDLIGNPIGNQDNLIGNPIGNQKLTTQKKGEMNKESIGNPIGKQIGNQLVIQKVIKNTDSYDAVFDKIMRLGGIESNVLSIIVDSCISRGLLTSSPITLEFLAKATGTTKKTAKTCTQRLVKKNILKRIDGRRGKGGWAIFDIVESVRNAVLEISKMGSIGNQLVIQKVNKLVINKESNRESEPSSSSIIKVLENLKTTTTGTNAENNSVQINSTEWDLLDCSPLAEIGFTKNHLIQIAQQNRLRPDVVQDSIHAFAFDLDENKKRERLNNPPLNFFMGILRKGVPYTPPDNYEPPELRAMRKYLETKKRIAEQAEALEQEIQTIEFSEWFGRLTSEQKQEFAPGVKGEGPMQKGFLRNYFDENIWPERRRMARNGAISS